jgi:carbon-monoxide dehydrogenase medium subunit
MTTLRRFEIHQPSSVAEASQMLVEFGENGSLYAGGTELLLAMRHGALRYSHLVDVKVIPGFDSIQLRDRYIEIGAGATHRTVERSPVVLERIKVLAQMESRVANVRVRASGTIGGNLCFAEPHSDPATLLLVLRATALISGPEASRTIGVDELIAGPYSNSLKPGELLVSIQVPCPSPRQRAAYVKYQVHERPTLGLALALDLAGDGTRIEAARVAVGCVCPFPRRSAAAEELLVGERGDVEASLERAANILADEAELIDDHEGGADYKRHLLGVFLKRAFEQCR